MQNEKQEIKSPYRNSDHDQSETEQLIVVYERSRKKNSTKKENNEMAIFYIANGQMLNIERTLCGVHCWIVHNVNRLHKEQLNETEWYRTM